MTPEEIRDMKARRRAGAAYNRSLTNTEAAPAPAPAPAPKPAPRQKMTLGEEEMVQDAKDAKMRKKIADMGYKSGGYVKAADGCAQRGKTKGRML